MESVAGCCEMPRAGAVDLVRRTRPDGSHSATFTGLVTCNSVWQCPICAPRISAQKAKRLAAEIDLAQSQHLRVVLVTLTFSHHQGEALRPMMENMKRAITRLRSGRKWHQLRERFAWAGFVRALEVTHGANGWHPHLHELWFLPDDVSAEAFGSEYRKLWAAAGEFAGLSMNEHGFHVGWRAGDLAQYVAKFGRWGVAGEVAAGSVKDGRAGSCTPFDLLYLASEGDAAAGRLYVEYVQAFKGRRQLYYSPGLRDLLHLGVEPSDDELAEAAEAEERAGAEVVVTLNLRQWWFVSGHIAEAAVLSLAEDGATGDEILAFVENLGPPGGARPAV